MKLPYRSSLFGFALWSMSMLSGCDFNLDRGTSAVAPRDLAPNCTQDQDCDLGSFCDEEVAACRPWRCLPGERQCQGSAVARCDEHGRGFLLAEPCPTGVCEQGRCICEETDVGGDVGECLGNDCECGLRPFCGEAGLCCEVDEACAKVDRCEGETCWTDSFCRPPCEGSICGPTAESCCQGELPVCNPLDQCAPSCEGQGELCGEAFDFCCPAGDICVYSECVTPDPVVITFINVGQADAILIQKGSLDVLVDAGRSLSPSLRSALSTITGSLDLLIITHPHLDHYGGAAGILREYQVDRIVTNGERRGPPRDPPGSGVRWLEFEEQAALVGLELETWGPGQRVHLTHALHFEVLATGGDFPNTPSGTDINNDSLVFMAHYQGRRILLTGDIETDAGQMLVGRYCNRGPGDCPTLRADILKVPHHGSGRFYEAFFQAARARFAVVSAAYDNAFGQQCLPRLETAEALVNSGARLKSTNQDGGRDVVALIEPTGEIWWDDDDPQTFFWRTERSDEGFVCHAKMCEVYLDEPATVLSCSLYGH